MSDVAERLAQVRARIREAAERAGRDPQTVRLVAVSKKQSLDSIRAARAAGQRDFGESYAQELREKVSALGELEDLRWHFIGHLQTNKARLVAPVACMVHAVDSETLGRELLRRADGGGLHTLIEVNLAAETQKGGVPPERALDLARRLVEIRGCGFELLGLMCLPPAGLPARPFFARLRALRDDIEQSLGRPLPELSMGMSGDFEDAIAEGSTLVRIGTAIFGPRA